MIDEDISQCEDSSKALEYLNNPNNFRSFSDGLTALIKKGSDPYQGDNTVEGKTSFLYEKLRSIGVSIKKPTIEAWFSGKHRPRLSSNSRTNMYQVCFSLNLNLSDVISFFHEVYFDRGFNCHTIEEAVYYYCFKNNQAYQKAIELIHTIQSPEFETTSSEIEDVVYTKEIKNWLDDFKNEEELLNFFKENKSIFEQWNQSAIEHIKRLLGEIHDHPSDKKMIQEEIQREQQKQRKKEEKKEENFVSEKKLQEKYSNCSLIVQEIFMDSHETALKEISGDNISSIDFMLDRIIFTNNGLKDATVSDIIKRNFPSKQSFSNLFKTFETSTAYDSIRKVLILLEFYDFWVKIKVSNNPELIRIKKALQSDVTDFSMSINFCPRMMFQDACNALLKECGYERLDFFHPYDWLFLWASSTNNPLDSLREAVSTMKEEE